MSQIPPSSSEPSSGGSWRPADHYESTPPAPGEKKGCPRWVPISCGTIGCLGILIIAGLGFYAAKNLPKLLGYYINTALEKNADASVTAEQKAALKAELQRFQRNLQTNQQAAAQDAQKIMQDMRHAMGDQKLDSEEVESLTRSLREANDRLENNPASTSVFAPRLLFLESPA